MATIVTKPGKGSPLRRSIGARGSGYSGTIRYHTSPPTDEIGTRSSFPNRDKVVEDEQLNTAYSSIVGARLRCEGHSLGFVGSNPSRDSAGCGGGGQRTLSFRGARYVGVRSIGGSADGYDRADLHRRVGGHYRPDRSHQQPAPDDVKCFSRTALPEALGGMEGAALLPCLRSKHHPLRRRNQGIKQALVFPRCRTGDMDRLANGHGGGHFPW